MGKSILIVDDAAFARRFIRKYLQVDGYEISEADNGRSALDIVRNQSPDCILTDILMPDLNGFEFLEILKQEGWQIPVIIITADIQDGSRDLCLELGAYGFINKPVKEDEVRQAVRKIFEDREETMLCNT